MSASFGETEFAWAFCGAGGQEELERKSWQTISNELLLVNYYIQTIANEPLPMNDL